MTTPPTVTINGSSPSGRYQWINASVAEEATPGRWTASFAPSSGTGITTPGSPATVRLLGVGFAGTTSDSRQPDPDRTLLKTRINEGQVNMAQNHGQYRVSVRHTGTWLRLHTFSRAGYFRIRVDGELASLRRTGLGGNLLNRTIDVQFASSAARTVEFELYHGIFPYGISCGPSDTVALPTAPSGKRLYVVGDSFSDGAQSTDKGFRDMIHLAAAEVGINDITMDALGGTGYWKTNGSAGTPAWANFMDRVGNNVGTGKAKPEIVLVCGSVNDKFASTAQVATNSAAVYATLNTALPGIPVAVAWFADNSTNDSNLSSRWSQIATTTAAAPNVVNAVNYMPYWTGTGNIASPQGDGTRDTYLDSDRTHPSQAGHEFLGHKIAVDILTPLL